jgi:hypothetical protein
MNYSEVIRAVKEIIMQMPTGRLILLWAIAITTVLAWKAADILKAVAELVK